MNFNIECELEDDGRWIAEIPELPGTGVFGLLRKIRSSYAFRK